ncbi:MAG: peptidoglycan DD-metalloendopeptidase family protein [Oscillospiraceae bacterium]|jgi:murein DD-endopeptidase MepM/ murein hydrolase activator NlpD|nr:peptidoglycan DD-metalloendopeptidase family protein [Oscillospiraceae bacterium]MCI9551029.1 peptidoglycan DD-metalloendopeptidase family protein [Oscillospiraceae bacterium]
MNKKTQRIIVIVLAAVLLLSLLASALAAIAYADVTKQDIQNIKDNLSDIQAQKKEVQKKLDSIRNDLSKAKEQVELIQGQVLLTEEEINTSQALLDQYDLQIAQKEAEIHTLEQQEEEQYQEFYRQVRWMEETGGTSYLSILFEASSFSEMLDYAMLITDIMDYSNRIIDQLNATQAQLGAARDDLAVGRADQAEVQQALEAKKAELEDQRAQAQTLLNQIAASESEYAAEAKKLADSEAQINKELKEAEKKYQAQLEALAQQNNVNMTSGDWYWPLPGRYKISSLFGNRADPFTGKRDNHTGTDIPAPSGTPIYAAKTGVVTTVNKNKNASSYGYYCIISHGNGYATLYAHQKQVPIVQEGQTVQKGQVIGYVGTTGRSTGNHLHFELRVNGVRNDVLRLYPGMTFTSPSGGKMSGG